MPANPVRVVGAGLLLLCCTRSLSQAAETIRLTRCEVSRNELPRGETFRLHLAAIGNGAEVRSYRLRTPYVVAKDEVPPGFYHANGYAVLQADKGAILDNGKFDLNPASGAVTVEVSTANLPEGVNYLVAFAHNRPGEGQHVLDYRNLRLDVGATRVNISVLASNDAPRSAAAFVVPAAGAETRKPVICGATLLGVPAAPLSLRVRPPYTWDKTEVLPGFRYDAEGKVGYLEDGPDHTIVDNGKLDRDPALGSVKIELPVDRWPPGAHFLSLEAPSLETLRVPYGATGRVYRDFFVDVPDPRDQFVIEVEPSTYFGKGTHFGSLVTLGNGVVLTDTHRSADGGKTWIRLKDDLPRPNVLADGALLGMAYRAYPVKGEKGIYTGSLFLSKDKGATVEGPLASRVLVPRARAALGHGPHVGPLFGRSIVELDDGSLISAMYGWFLGDTEPDRYRKGGTMRRSYLCKSTDRGRTWEYLSTVAYEPFLGNEGYSELVIRKLPNGEILALVRTGGNSNPGWQDNPLMMSRSKDGGKTWSAVERTGVEGVWPDLCVMHDGALACSTGRPGAFVMFSTDNGHTWTDLTPLDAERYSGYTALCEVAPGELLVGYGAQNWHDPETGERSDQLRLVRLHVRKR